MVSCKYTSLSSRHDESISRARDDCQLPPPAQRQSPIGPLGASRPSSAAEPPPPAQIQSVLSFAILCCLLPGCPPPRCRSLPRTALESWLPAAATFHAGLSKLFAKVERRGR